MKYKNVVIAGGGVLGSQIAFQTAYCGFNTTILVREDDDQKEINKKLNTLKKTYLKSIELMSTRSGKKGSNWCNGIASLETFKKRECIKKLKEMKLRIVTNQGEALSDADLLIESITENIYIKKDFYEGISKVLPEKTVIVTNSSTLLPSKMAKATKRPNKYLAMHFANNIWKQNIAEIMAQSETEDKYFDEITEFAKAINMVPLTAREEKSGYLLNSMLVPFLLSAMDLLANGISDAENIDKAWTLGTGAPAGPFQILDVVGLITAKNIVLQYQKVPNIFDPLLKKMMLPYNFDGMLEILNKYIDEGKLGKSTGEGFYKYDK